MFYKSLIKMRPLLLQALPLLKEKCPDAPIWKHPKLCGMETVCALLSCASQR